MELVYLWVEDYKNIQKQGFNFSLRFNCKYDDVKKELSIDENNDYIKNFFGENINITAIVGKNGSGKSSVLESILDVLSANSYLNCSSSKLLVYKYQNELYFESCNIFDINHNKELIKETDNIEQQHNDTFISAYLDTVVIYLDNQSITSSLNIFERLKIIPSKFSCDQIEIVDTNTNKNFIQKVMLENYKKYPNLSFISDSNKFFIPKKIKISFNINKEKKFLLGEKKEEINQLEKDLKKNIKNLKFKEFWHKILEVMDIYSNNKNYNIADNTLENILGLNKPNYYYPKEFKNKYDNYLDSLVTEEDFFSINIDNLSNEKIEFLNALPLSIFEFDLIDSTKSFNSLSYGEKQLLTQLHNILFFSDNKSYNKTNNNTGDDKDEKINNILIFLDEFEIGLHPEWQKKSIKYITDFLSSIDKNFQLILTSHSPFLLSDIPKQNIIFLDKDEKGNCKVVDRLKEKKQTFGANIHTLLSDSFFMKDGLMGEFAKSKINEIIDFQKEVEEENKKKESNFVSLQDEYKDNKTKFWDVQKIIGEDYLKQVIKNHLIDIENILLGHDGAREEEIKRLREEADRLEKM